MPEQAKRISFVLVRLLLKMFIIIIKLFHVFIGDPHRPKLQKGRQDGSLAGCGTAAALSICPMKQLYKIIYNCFINSFPLFHQGDRIPDLFCEN
jgi:hypothetical protein